MATIRAFIAAAIGAAVLLPAIWTPLEAYDPVGTIARVQLHPGNRRVVRHEEPGASLDKLRLPPGIKAHHAGAKRGCLSRPSDSNAAAFCVATSTPLVDRRPPAGLLRPFPRDTI